MAALSYTPLETTSQRDEILDHKHLDRQTFGDDALKMEILQLFVLQSSKNAERLLAEGEDRNGKIEAVHTIKGSARAIGAWSVADLADQIETLLRQEQDIDGALAVFIQSLSMANAAILTLIAEAA